MTEEQRDMLEEWVINLIVEHRLDYFRGNALNSAVHCFATKSSWTHYEAIHYCQDAESRNVRIRTNDYDELSKELDELSKPCATKQHHHLRYQLYLPRRMERCYIVHQGA